MHSFSDKIIFDTNMRIRIALFSMARKHYISCYHFQEELTNYFKLKFKEGSCQFPIDFFEI